MLAAQFKIHQLRSGQLDSDGTRKLIDGAHPYPGVCCSVNFSNIGEHTCENMLAAQKRRKRGHALLNVCADGNIVQERVHACWLLHQNGHLRFKGFGCKE